MLQPYTITAAIPERGHVLDYFAGYAKALGLPDPPQRTILVLDESERNVARALLREYGVSPGDRWLALQPGRDRREYYWSTDKFVTLADKLRRNLGYPILIFQAPNDASSIAQEVCRRLGKGVILVPLLPIRHYAAVLERCTLLVTSEGGPGHIAAALGVKTIILFTDPRCSTSYWFPYTREQHMVALEELPGKDLSVQEVFSAAEALCEAGAHGC
jgi:ADP-heptose:LPS heptosyltransferase